MNKKVRRGGFDPLFRRMFWFRLFPLAVAVILSGCAVASTMDEAGSRIETPSPALILGPGYVIEVKYRFWP